MKEKVIFCVDIKAFYASVECVDRGFDPLNTPLVVCDKTRGSGTIILSVTPFLKEQGILSRLRLYELPKRNDIIYAKPRMERYLNISSKIIEVFLDFVGDDDIHIYSIDESFLDFTHYLSYYRQSPLEIAKALLKSLNKNTGLYATIGISNSLFSSKVALDTEAKQNTDGIAYWPSAIVKEKLAKITPLSNTWGIGKRLEKRLNALGFFSLGDIQKANKQFLKEHLGIIGLEIYNHANGLDYSDIREKYSPCDRSISIGQVLLEDYFQEDILVVIQEMTDDLILKMILSHLMGQTLHLNIHYSKDCGGGFSRQQKLDKPTFDYEIIFEGFKQLFLKYYDGSPIRKISIAIGSLIPLTHYQLDLFHTYEELEKKYALQRAIYSIKKKYGPSSVLRLKDLTKASTAKSRHEKLGGHNRK